MMKVLVLSLVLHVVASSDCTPGRITGISCPSFKDLILELKPSVDAIKTKISTVYQTTGDTAVSTRLLVRDNIASARNLTSQKFLQMRKLLNLAKIEVMRASPRVKLCVNEQGLELTKIRPALFLGCNGNFSALAAVRMEMLKLGRVAVDTIDFCAKLNPLDTAIGNIRVCVGMKVKDLELQLLALEHKFADRVKELVTFSTDCVVREIGQVHARIGAIEGALRNCRNVR